MSAIVQDTLQHERQTVCLLRLEYKQEEKKTKVKSLRD